MSGPYREAPLCSGCQYPLTAEELRHGQDKYTPDHEGRCCDCFDISVFPDALDVINRERAAKGKTPIKS